MKFHYVKLSLFSAFVGMAYFITSCDGNGSKVVEQPEAKDTLMSEAQTYFQVLPAEEPGADQQAKILLGRTLFHDVRLSKNNTQSCNTCHNLATYGVDNKPVSEGDLGKTGARNSPTVYNAAFHFAQFWDGRAQHVEEQAGMPILNPVEMNMPSENFVVDRLKSIQGYKTLFAQAFPDAKDPITYENLKTAIGAFERTLSTPGKFHQYLAGDANALNAEEKAGLKKFIEVGCITCHISATVGGNMFQKFPLIGQEYKSFTGSKTEDLGKMDVSKKESDKFIFKVPSLLNIGKTAPYFHDGSVADLGQAIQIMGKLQLNKDLNDGDVSEIKAFLHALTADVPKDALIIPEMPK